MVFGFIKSAVEWNRKKEKNIIMTIIRSESISCNRCDNLAAPIYNTRNKYKCTGCGRQFANSKHDIAKCVEGRGLIHSGLYDECINDIS